MRHMPTILSNGAEIPTMPVEEFNEKLLQLLDNQPLSKEEGLFVEKATRHNWTLSVIVDHIRNTRSRTYES